MYNAQSFVYSYESLTIPRILYEYDVLTKQSTVIFNKRVPNYDQSLYETGLLEARGHDGVMIPISSCCRKDMFRCGATPQPLLLYAYGAYGTCIEPNFNQKWVSLMDRGFICCIAHIRGGGEKGYDWYLDGKMDRKMNTFKDFISCAEHLISIGYTNSSRLVAEGRSAGGLTMGCAVTMRPELFKTVVLGVPFVDVVVTMADPTIPLTTSEWNEWGNSNVPEQFDQLLEYSPMECVKISKYPNTLIQCGLHDPRVGFWEPTKFHIRIKDLAQDTNTHLLRVDMDRGHFSNSDRYKQIRECAYQYAFVLSTLT
jgi:oligopeptidase B